MVLTKKYPYQWVVLYPYIRRRSGNREGYPDILTRGPGIISGEDITWVLGFYNKHEINKKSKDSLQEDLNVF